MKILASRCSRCSLPPPPCAADNVSLTSKVFVERVKQDADGKPVTVREEPGVVTPGDRLVFVLSYRNGGAAAGDRLRRHQSDSRRRSPLPAPTTRARVVSVDGGKSWGALAVAQGRAARTAPAARAVAADVTHIRWSFGQPIAAGAAGELSFRGVVE